MNHSLLTAFQASFESDLPEADDFVDDEVQTLNDIEALREETAEELAIHQAEAAADLRTISSAVEEVSEVLVQANAVASTENAKHYALLLNTSLENIQRRVQIDVPRLELDATDCITQTSMESLLGWVKKALGFLSNVIKQGWENFNLGRRRLFKTLTTLNSRGVYIRRKLEQRKNALAGGQAMRLPPKRIERLVLRDGFVTPLGDELQRFVKLMQVYSNTIGPEYAAIAQHAAGQIGDVIAQAARGDDVDIDVSAVDKLIAALASFRDGQSLFLGNRFFEASISDRARRNTNVLSGVENAIEKLQGVESLVEVVGQPDARQVAGRLGSPVSLTADGVLALVAAIEQSLPEVKASDVATGELVDQQSELLEACASALEKAFGSPINHTDARGQVLQTDHIVTDRALAAVVGYYTELAEQVYGFNTGWLAIYEAFVQSADAALYLAEESVLKSV